MPRWFLVRRSEQARGAAGERRAAAERRARACGWVGAALVVLTAGPAPAVTLPPAIRGQAAVVLKTSRPDLVVTITKFDLNLYEGADLLVGELYDGHRQHVASCRIEDDGNPNKGGGQTAQPQTAELRARVAAPGICRLEVGAPTSSETVWGFETNADGYLVTGCDTLNNGAAGAPILFLPPVKPGRLTLQALHQPGVQKAPLTDAAGKLLHTFNLAKPGQDDSFEVTATTGDRSGPWRLELAHLDVKWSLAGVSWWTADPAAFFDVQPYEHLIFPFHQVRHVEPGGSARLVYQLRNRTATPAVYRVGLEAPAEITARLAAPAGPVAVNPLGQAEVVVELTADKPLANAVRGAVTVVREDRPEVATSAGFELRPGPSPVSRPVPVPIVEQAYQHENGQFGYAPDYVANEVYFDLHNRPVIRERTANKYVSTGLEFLTADGWVHRSFMEALKAAFPEYRGMYGASGFLGAKVAFDGDGDAYTLVSVRAPMAETALLHTADEGRTYEVIKLPGGSINLEQFTGHNALREPPPVLVHKKTADFPARFADVNDLLLYLPRKAGGKLVVGEPVLVSRRDLGACQHSGGPAATATRDGRTHLVWGEVTEDKVPGVPTYAATFDHASRRLSEKLFVGYAPPVNDVHNVPGVCLDSAGYVHIITGAHGEPFVYRRSLKPNDVSAGLTDPVPVLSAGRITKDSDADGVGGQTYLSLVCGPDDTLSIAYRQWRAGVDPWFDGALYAALSFQQKPKDGPWGPAQPIVVPPRPGYSIYYHKLTIDRRGRLYLSYSYLTEDATYQSDFPDLYHHRALVMSADGGRTWKLVETSDFRQEIIPSTTR